MYLKYLEPVPCSSPFSIPLGCMVGWLQWLMATTYIYIYLPIWQETFFIHKRKVPSPGFYCPMCTLEVTTVTCLLPRMTEWTWEGACCECGHAHSSGGQGVLHPGTVVTPLKSGTNTSVLTSSSGVRTSASVLLTLISTHKGECGWGGRRKWRLKRSL